MMQHDSTFVNSLNIDCYFNFSSDNIFLRRRNDFYAIFEKL